MHAYNQPYLSTGSKFVDSTNHGSKIIRENKKQKKNYRKFQIAKLEFAAHYLYGFHIVINISNLEMI